jgi:ankyrin repeat protein
MRSSLICRKLSERFEMMCYRTSIQRKILSLSSRVLAPNKRYFSTTVVSLNVQQDAALNVDDDTIISNFFTSAKTNNEAAVEDILESAAFKQLKDSVNFTDAFGNSPLMICSQRNWSESIQILLLNDYCDINHQNLFGSSALMCSSSHGHLDALKSLLKSSKLQIDMESRFGQTALMKAAQAGKLESIKILIANGADATIRNKQGKGALEIAQEKEHSRVVEFLQSRIHIEAT